ncbi:MAG: hypothetical protein OEX02_18565 [Cyclobacteriaceae bacterium]|nr:hypothetical protein [Cyclobacteriaceae bacterium]
MQKTNYSLPLSATILLLVVSFLFNTGAFAQSDNISVYAYRKVPAENMGEFVERETKYWSKVAKKAIDEGKLEFWGLFYRIDGDDMQNEPNFLFVNVFKDADQAMDYSIWDTKKVFPDVPLEKISTANLSTTTSRYMFQSIRSESKSDISDEDLKYVKIYYHNSSNPYSYVQTEAEHWGPFIKKAMDTGLTSQVAWGNDRLLTPMGPDIPFTSVSWDFYPSLQSTLMPQWKDGTEFPTQMFEEMEKTMIGDRWGQEVYQAVIMIGK